MRLLPFYTARCRLVASGQPFLLTMSAMTKAELHILTSGEAPCGVRKRSFRGGAKRRMIEPASRAARGSRRRKEDLI
jgi:hypothetical protein